MQSEVVIRLETRFSAPMELLRRVGYGLETTSQDQFDHDRSLHAVALIASEPVGMVRLTPGLPSVLASWCRGELAVPTGEDVVELTRGVVHPHWRRCGIYEALMIRTLLASKALGKRVATGVLEPGSRIQPFLRSLGFEIGSSAMRFCDWPREVTMGTQILLELSCMDEGHLQKRFQQLQLRAPPRTNGLHFRLDDAIPPLPSGRGLGDPPWKR